MQGSGGTHLLFGVLLASPCPPSPLCTLTQAPAGMAEPGTLWGCNTEGELRRRRMRRTGVWGGECWQSPMGKAAGPQASRRRPPPAPPPAWPSLGRKKKELVPRITCFAFLRCLRGNFD